MSNRQSIPFETTHLVRDTCLCLHTQRAARALARRFDEALRPVGLTNGQFSLLMSLNRPQPATMGSVASLLAMAYLIWQALQMGATNVALLGVLFAVVGVWQIEPMIRLNKPRPFRSEALPEELLPKAG